MKIARSARVLAVATPRLRRRLHNKKRQYHLRQLRLRIDNTQVTRRNLFAVEKRKQTRAFLRNLPRTISQYRIRYRMRSKISRTRLTSLVITRQKLLNRGNRSKKIRRYLKQQRKNSAWARAHQPLTRPAVVKYEEQFKRDLFRRR